MDGLQLPLPAGWAMERLSSKRDPQEQLTELEHDKVDARAEIRAVLDRLAEKHGLGAREVGAAVQGYADDMINDAAYELERELKHALEDRDGPSGA